MLIPACFFQGELLDVIYWYRQIICFAIGICWGTFEFVGAFAFMGFFLLTALLQLVYAKLFFIKGEDIVETWDILKEGFMPGFTVFLVCFIISKAFFNF